MFDKFSQKANKGNKLVRPIILNLSFMLISYVNIIKRDAVTSFL